MRKIKKNVIAAGGWIAFGLGWLGVFIPGLPTTIFWILAALAFVRTNERAYAKVISNKRFGSSIRLFVEEGKIRARGKVISIMAMLGFALIGVLAIPPIWVKILVASAACAGSLWVAVLPSPAAHSPRRPRLSGCIFPF